jgi:hypothetical protein
MSCPVAFDSLPLATEYLSDDLYKRAYPQSVFMNLVPRTEFIRNKGVTQTSFQLGRSMPTADEPAWTPITLNDVGSTICQNTFNDVQVGFDSTTFSPEKYQLAGPILCQDSLIYEHNPEQFWNGYLNALAKNSAQVLENNLLANYIKNSDKAAATAAYPRYSQSTLVMAAATSELTQDMLDITAIELNQDGANVPNSDGFLTLGDQGPIYTLLIGQRASRRLFKNNAEVRSDVRYAQMGEGDGATLMKRMGAATTLGSFRHLITLFPPRYTYAAGTYTRVNTWEMVAGTKGYKAQVTNAYKHAPFEAAIVLHPWVQKEHIVRPVNKLNSMSWMPKDYMGNWTWVTGAKDIQADTSCLDPLKKYGRHFAEYDHAIEKIYGEFGRVIIFARCDGDTETALCS